MKCTTANTTACSTGQLVIRKDGMVLKTKKDNLGIRRFVPIDGGEIRISFFQDCEPCHDEKINGMMKHYGDKPFNAVSFFQDFAPELAQDVANAELKLDAFSLSAADEEGLEDERNNAYNEMFNTIASVLTYGGLNPTVALHEYLKEVQRLARDYSEVEAEYFAHMERIECLEPYTFNYYE